MSAHTPGPWAQWVGHESVHANVVENELHAITGTPVCSLPDRLEWEEDDGRDPAEWDANMRLIVAAPDLLAALKALLKTTSRTPQERVDERRAVAFSVIAKVEGKS